MPHRLASTCWVRPFAFRMALILIPNPACASLRVGLDTHWSRFFRWPGPGGFRGRRGLLVLLRVLPCCRRDWRPRRAPSRAIAARGTAFARCAMLLRAAGQGEPLLASRSCLVRDLFNGPLSNRVAEIISVDSLEQLRRLGIKLAGDTEKRCQGCVHPAILDLPHLSRRDAAHFGEGRLRQPPALPHRSHSSPELSLSGYTVHVFSEMPGPLQRLSSSCELVLQRAGRGDLNQLMSSRPRFQANGAAHNAYNTHCIQSMSSGYSIKNVLCALNIKDRLGLRSSCCFFIIPARAAT
jgi:hypothetical protein